VGDQCTPAPTTHRVCTTRWFAACCMPCRVSSKAHACAVCSSRSYKLASIENAIDVGTVRTNVARFVPFLPHACWHFWTLLGGSLTCACTAPVVLCCVGCVRALTEYYEDAASVEPSATRPRVVVSVKPDGDEVGCSTVTSGVAHTQPLAIACVALVALFVHSMAREEWLV